MDDIFDKCVAADRLVRKRLGVADGSVIPAHQKELYAVMMAAVQQKKEDETHEMLVLNASDIQPSRQLVEWAQKPPVDVDNFRPGKGHGYGPGGPESVATELRTLTMDHDSSGDISREEQEAAAISVTDSINSLLVNMGVVGALLLSIILPYALTPIEPVEATVEFFGKKWADVFGYAFHIASLVLLLICLDLIFKTLCAYKWLNFWMINAEMKLYFAKHSNSRVVIPIIAGAQSIMWIFPFTIPFACVTYISPLSGAIALGIMLIFFFNQLVYFQWNEFYFSAYQHQIARQVIGEIDLASDSRGTGARSKVQIVPMPAL
jgi:hypothetical protein